MLTSEQTVLGKIPQGQTICTLMEAACARFGDATAYECGRAELTFTEVERLSRIVAGALTRFAGLEEGDRIAVMTPNLLEFPLMTFGILRAGFTQVNVNPLYTTKELRHQLCDSGARAIFVHEIAFPTLSEVIADTEIEAVIVLPANPAAPGTYTFARAGRPIETVLFAKFLERGVGIGQLEKSPTPSDLAFLQYTGGTTGFAKGAMLTHANIVANVYQFAECTKDRLSVGEEVVITPLPLYHIFALAVNMIAMLHLGARNILITNPRDMDGLVSAWAKGGVSFTTGVNTLFNGLVNHPEFKKLDFSKLRLAVGGGAPVQEATSNRWKAVTGQHLAEGYGLSETSPVLTLSDMSDTGFYSSIGLPIPDTQISIRDDDGNEVADGEAGELCARGPQVMQGYWNKPDETSKVMTADGFFRTGDIAQIGSDGRLRIVDRKKDMILVSGFNVYPNEIEAEIAQHDGVLEAACVGLPDPRTGEAVTLFITKKDADLTEKTVKSFCRERLAAYKVPSRIVFIDEIPKSTVGKILRRELRAEWLERAPSV